MHMLCRQQVIQRFIHDITNCMCFIYNAIWWQKAERGHGFNPVLLHATFPQKKLSLEQKITIQSPSEKGAEGWLTHSYVHTKTLHINIHTPTDRAPTHVCLPVALLRPCLSLSGIFALPGWACLSIVQTGSSKTHKHTHTEKKIKREVEEKKEWNEEQKMATIKAPDWLCPICLCVCAHAQQCEHLSGDKCHCCEKIT